MRGILSILAFAVVSGGCLFAATVAEAQHDAEPPSTLDCAALDCASVLPGADRFTREAGHAYATGYRGDEVVGWVVLSTDVVDVQAYSGKPLVTLVGLDTEGVIAGARVLHHSEPILLVGIPVSALHDFVAFYVGKRADARIVVGHTSAPDSVSVDVISGATVTSLAENRTILESARVLGQAVGVVEARSVRPGHFVADDEPWSWSRMVDEGVFGRLTVTQAQMGAGTSSAPFVDLWYTVADAPQVGRALFGDRQYEYLMGLLEPGQHLFVILGNGSSSFKGSAFVRGGIFDRVRVDQGLTELVFRDTDYQNFSSVQAEGAPRFREGAVFVTRGAPLDPGRELTLVFLGSHYDGRGGFSRDFREFKSSLTLPESVYVVDGGAEDEPIWVQAWRNHVFDLVALGVYLALVLAVFVGRRWSTGDPKRLARLHVASMVIAFLMVGVYMRAQPSVTQILTLVDSVIHGWRFELFASEPLIFVLWIFIAVVSLIWGRGVFCGWVCPYGAMSELTFKIGKLLRLPKIELPDRWHRRLRYVRYVVLFGLVPVFLWDSILGEKLAEIEPFKSSFLVYAWERHWFFFLWWALLLVLSLFWYRPFCRYLCPMGGGLALLNNFRFAGPRRRKFCSSCKICTRGCEPRAIREDGTIDPRECLSCMECEANYRDEEVCPPLVSINRLTAKSKLTEKEQARLERLRVDREDV